MALVTCPDCNREISSEAKSCPNCGLPTKRIKKISPSTIENSTRFTEEKMGLAQRIATGIVTIFIGMAVLLIPIIGWIAGPILILGGLIVPLMGGTSSITQKGTCPYCTLQVSNFNAAAESFSCSHCKQPIIVRAPSFYTVAAAHSSSSNSNEAQASDVSAATQREFASPDSTVRIAKGGEDIGEHPVSKIRDWIASGFISEDDFFWDQNVNQWRSVSELKLPAA